MYKILFINSFLYIKMINKYCRKHKKIPGKKVRERYENLSEED